MPKMPPEQRLRSALADLGCRLVDKRVHCNCGVDMKVNWSPDIAEDLRIFHNMADADEQMVNAAVSCTEYLLSTHRKVCNVPRRDA